MRYCAACGIEIDSPFWLCQTCASNFGVSGTNYKAWPRELKYLKNSVCREIYDAGRKTISIDELADNGIDIDEDGNIYTDSELREIEYDDGPLAEPFMRYAPYKDEAQNREYRRANGIPERKA